MKKNKTFFTVVMVAIFIVLLTNVNRRSETCQSVFAKDISLYSSYEKKIDKFMTSFSNGYTNYILELDNPIKEIKGSANINSAEGNEMICYKDSKGNILRYCLTIYGESGQSVENYYLIGRNQMYVVVLKSMYSYPMLNSISNDILNYDMKQYIIDGGKTYSYNSQDKTIRKINKSKIKNVYFSKKELDSLFNIN